MEVRQDVARPDDPAASAAPTSTSASGRGLKARSLAAVDEKPVAGSPRRSVPCPRGGVRFGAGGALAQIFGFPAVGDPHRSRSACASCDRTRRRNGAAGGAGRRSHGVGPERIRGAAWCRRTPRAAVSPEPHRASPSDGRFAARVGKGGAAWEDATPLAVTSVGEPDVRRRVSRRSRSPRSTRIRWRCPCRRCRRRCRDRRRRG